MLKKLQKWFTLVELMVVVVIIAIFATAAYISATSYIARAQDATRKTDLEALSQAISTFKGSHLAPPLNQYWLVEAGLLNTLPVDPSNQKLYQYNADIRGWSKNYMSQGSSQMNYLLATNQPLFDKDDDVYDGDKYMANKTGHTTKVKNLKYYGWYLVVWPGDANLLTDNGKQDTSNTNRSPVAWWPSTAPANCWSVDAGSASSQLDPYTGDLEALKDKTTKNVWLTVWDVYGATVAWSICKISIKWSDGKWVSPADLSKNPNDATGNPDYTNQYN